MSARPSSTTQAVVLEAFQDAMASAHGYRPQVFASGVLVNSRDADRFEGYQLALTAAQQQGQAVAWRPMESAPRDGTMVRLLVEFTDHATEDAETAPTIGACNDDNVPEDERIGWQFAGWCWDHDHFTEGKGTPVGWLPMLDTAPPPSVPDGWALVPKHPTVPMIEAFEAVAQARGNKMKAHEALSAMLAAAPALAQQPAAVGEAGYRLLVRGDVVRAGDEVLHDDCRQWIALAGWEIGMVYDPLVFVPVRRKQSDTQHQEPTTPP